MEKLICTQNCTGRMDNRKAVYFINELRKTDKGYQVCIAKEEEQGYYLTDWFWNCDIKQAKKLCDEKNKMMGINKKDALLIVLRSMRLNKRREDENRNRN